MRLMIEFKPKQNVTLNSISNYSIQGFIYKLLKNTEFSWIHSYKGFKMFCFSNIIPIEKDGILKQDKSYKLIISSPNPQMIKAMKNNLKNLKEFRLDNYKFEIQRAKSFKIKLSFPWKTSTPIILIKNKDVYLSDKKDVYKVSVKVLNHPMLKLFKKSKMKNEQIDLKNAKEIKLNQLPFLDKKKFKIVKVIDVYYNFQKGDNFFDWLRDLKDNSLEKYFSFTGYHFYFEENLFDELEFWKSVSIVNRIKGKDVIRIGTLWKKLNVLRSLDREEKNFYYFIMESGLGVLNSLGFGFVNPLKVEKKPKLDNSV